LSEKLSHTFDWPQARLTTKHFLLVQILDKEDFSKLTDQVKEIPFNNLFARAVVENMVSGTVYVDNPLAIKTAYIIHPYGMTLLLGDPNNESFNEQFKLYALNTDGKRNSFEWMQCYPGSWENKLTGLFDELLIPSHKNELQQEKGIIELNTRVNFKFDKEAYLINKVETHDPNIKIVPADRQMFREMRGSVVPKYFWDSEDIFF
jgi:hypothetical protein